MTRSAILCGPVAEGFIPLPEALVRVSLPLPLEIVATDISQGDNEDARSPGRGGGWGMRNASGRKQEAW